MKRVEDRKLPNGWQLVQLGEIAAYTNGRAFKPTEWTDTGFPIIRIQNLNDKGAHFNHFDGELDDRYLVKDGDLLVSWSASLDAYIWDRGDSALNQHIFKVVVNEKLIYRNYLYFALREVMSEIREQTHGATMKHITKPEFEAFPIPLPPLREQQRIATILTEQLAAVAQARKASEARMEAARALPAAYLREVFESGEAKSWEVKPMEEVADLLPSKSIATAGDKEVSAITTACLTEEGFDPKGIKIAKMDAKDAKESIVSPGEILIARSNTPELVGRISIFLGEPRGVVASDLTIRIWPKTEIVPGFLGYFLSYLYLTGYWRDHAGGASGSMKKITRTQVLQKEVSVPSAEVQSRVSNYLGAKILEAKNLRELLASELLDVRCLSASLLRQAFSGAI